eukprot:Mrub_08445.p1 GENE.Mrub_08445~~Mrub_08445.p1  ORF type:complete len:256 (+),score=42.11 Mrub_08445:31-768(+)
MDKDNWYSKSKDYWSTQNSEYGVVGCIDDISEIDLKFTDNVLSKLRDRSIIETPNDTCIDFGAGVGRVTKHVLSRHFKNITLVEQCSNMCDQMKVEFDTLKPVYSSHHFTVVNESLQNFENLRHKPKYDLVVCDWILSHLYDDDMINFLDVIKSNMHPHSTLIVKDNVNNNGDDDEFDQNDFTVTRPVKKQEMLFTCCGFDIVYKEMQPDWPGDLFPVYIWAMKQQTVDSETYLIKEAEDLDERE